MAFRDRDSIDDEIRTILQSMGTLLMHRLDSDISYKVKDFKRDMKEYVLQAYRSGYYDGKGDTVQFLLANGYVKAKEVDDDDYI